MQVFKVDDMTCGHCASTITKAIRSVDAGAKVEVDVAGHLVSVETAEADAREIADAITEAGYTPVPATAAPAAAPAKKSGCCGCCG